jgi:hypothetical protein
MDQRDRPADLRVLQRAQPTGLRRSVLEDRIA